MPVSEPGPVADTHDLMARYPRTAVGHNARPGGWDDGPDGPDIRPRPAAGALVARARSSARPRAEGAVGRGPWWGTRPLGTPGIFCIRTAQQRSWHMLLGGPAPTATIAGATRGATHPQQERQ
ncbi:hypothetical protein GCM10025734_12950 [Kitasatospora paranensis]